MAPHLSVLHATLLAFAGWTLVVLIVTIGAHRWSRILTGRSRIHEFPADAPTGPAWYRRATRAHLNCVENLPVYGAIVFVATAAGVAGPQLDALGLVVLGSRIAQTTVHVLWTETPRSVSVRFSCFALQLLAMLAMLVGVFLS